MELLNLSGELGQDIPQQGLPTTSQCATSSNNSDAAVGFEAPRVSLESQVLTQREVDEKPWKYIGYPGYSSFLASDSDFLIFRRFSSASARICLRLQDRVTLLQEELSKLDRRFGRREQEDIHNGSFRQEDDERGKVLDEMEAALSKYYAFVVQYAKLKKYPRAPPQDIQSLLNWHRNHNSCAIAEEERNYLTHVHDLFSLAPKIKTPLRRLLEKSRRFKLHWIWRDSNVPELPMYDKNEAKYFSDKRIDGFITVIIIALGTPMLIAPMWILPNVDNTNAKLGAITSFVMLFLGLISYTTVAKPFESLAATAAYAAVLTVFLQLGSAV